LKNPKQLNDFLSHIKNGKSSKPDLNPKISIVMPSYNQAKFIERSIISVINQNYINLQLIIIDGNSTDGTIDIIKKYERHIDYWLSEIDNGQSDALNKGFQVADGEIFGWLNSDDIYMPNTLNTIANCFIKNKNKSIVFGDWLSIDEQDKIIDLHYAFNFNLNHFKYEGFHLNAQAMFWKKEVHLKFNNFDLNLYNTMDYQMILEFGINEGNKSFYRVKNVLGAFRRYEGQKTTHLSKRVLNEHKYIAKKYKYIDKFSYKGKIKRLGYRFRRAYWYFIRGNLNELMYRVLKSFKIKFNL
jgi:glycosyltransferase involved in cell wall biosynthesis